MKVSTEYTVEHFNIAALKNCDPNTMTLIATLKNATLALSDVWY